MTPLTHREILTLIEPFVRQGRHLDLAATDRRERRLVLKPIRHAGGPDGQGPIADSLMLACPDPGPGESAALSLTRTLTDATGLAATATTSGTDPAALLAQLEALAPAGQLAPVRGRPVARSYRLAAVPSDDAATPDEDPRRPHLTQATAVVGPLQMTFDTQIPRAGQMRIQIVNTDGLARRLPADLLAVLGPAWQPLQPDGDGWRTVVRVADREPARTADAEQRIAEAVAHLDRALQQPPGAFHRQFRRARLAFFWRRNLGLLGQIGVLALGPAIHAFNPSEESIFFMLSYFWPTLLLMALPLYVERLVFAPAPRPRPLSATAWDPRHFSPSGPSSGPTSDPVSGPLSDQAAGQADAAA